MAEDQAWLKNLPRHKTPWFLRCCYGARSVVFILSVWGSMLILGFWIPILYLLPQDARWRWGQRWVRLVLFNLGWICQLRHEVRGREHLPTGSAIIACKHQSAWETLIFMPLLGRPAYVLKKELLRVPMFGPYLTLLGMIPIDRSKGADALAIMLDAARKVMAEGRSLVLYPEGTRTAVGTRGKFRKRGICTLYRELNLPVVPVAINSGVFWGRREVVKYPGRITIEILPPIPAGLPEKEMFDLLEQAVEEASLALAKEVTSG